MTNQADCLACPAGYYCVENSTTYADQLCPSGHYCPENTTYDIEYKCPEGTFNALDGRLKSERLVLVGKKFHTSIHVSYLNQCEKCLWEENFVIF